MTAPVKRKQDPGNLVFMDLEMTGLDVERDVILQAGLVITDAQLDILEEYSCDVWQPEAELEKMTPFVRHMHEKTGLLERVRAATRELAAVEHDLLERVSGFCPYPALLCGNSIGSDKRFIDRHMPGLGRYLHYRIVDVSSLKMLAKLWYGDRAAYQRPKEGAHDALVDAKNSVAELRHYRATLFRR